MRSGHNTFEQREILSKQRKFILFYVQNKFKLTVSIEELIGLFSPGVEK